MKRSFLFPLICAGLNLLAPGTSQAIVKVSQMIGFSTGQLGTVGAAEAWNGPSGNVTLTSGSGSLDRRLLLGRVPASKPAQAKSPSCARAAATPAREAARSVRGK